jgi:pyruvate dehydrogenase kinase 2/3/4
MGVLAAAKRAAASTVAQGHRLVDVLEREAVDDIFAHALKKQTGVSLKYM